MEKNSQEYAKIRVQEYFLLIVGLNSCLLLLIVFVMLSKLM